MPLKTVNIFGVLQVFALTGCYVFLNWFAKIYEKTSYGFDYYNLNGWLERMGIFKSLTLALFLIPVATAIFCMLRAKVSRGVQWLGPRTMTLLVIVTGGIWIFSAVVSLLALGGPTVRNRITILR